MGQEPIETTLVTWAPTQPPLAFVRRLGFA
jgi:hypothetical protein